MLRFGHIWGLMVAVVATLGCNAVNPRSGDFHCETIADCEAPRTCVAGHCVLGAADLPDADPNAPDADPNAPDARPLPDADPNAPDAVPSPDANLNCDMGCGTCAGGCCNETCSTGNCNPTCAPGCECNFHCEETAGKCTYNCDEATCNIDCDGAADCSPRCGDGSGGAGADCTINCTGSADCAPDCKSSANCDVNCTSSNDCYVKCQDSDNCSVDCTTGSCRLDCAGATTCGFSACTTGEMSCADDVVVCNQPCPPII